MSWTSHPGQQGGRCRASTASMRPAFCPGSSRCRRLKQSTSALSLATEIGGALRQHNTCPICRCQVESSCPQYNRLNRSPAPKRLQLPNSRQSARCTDLGVADPDQRPLPLPLRNCSGRAQRFYRRNDPHCCMGCDAVCASAGTSFRGRFEKRPSPPRSPPPPPPPPAPLPPGRDFCRAWSLSLRQPPPPPAVAAGAPRRRRAGRAWVSCAAGRQPCADPRRRRRRRFNTALGSDPRR